MWFWTVILTDVTAVPEDQMILDVGPKSVADMTALLSETRTLLWNGPLGAFEIDPFGVGTFCMGARVYC